MNRSELISSEKEIISILDEAFVQSLEIVLSSLSEEPISITTKDLNLKIDDAFTEQCLSIKTDYIEGFSGYDRMLFKLKDAIPFTQLAMGEKIDVSVVDLDDLHQSVFSEIASQVVSSTITTISGKINKKINFSFPEISVITMPGNLPEPKEESIELYFSLSVGSLIDSYFLYQIPKNWINYLSGKGAESAPEPVPLPQAERFISEVPPLEVPPLKEEKVTSKPVTSIPAYDFEEPAVTQQKSYQAEIPYQMPGKTEQEMVVKPARFSQLVPSRDRGPSNSIDLFLDVPMKLTAVLGRAVLYLKDVLDMGSGSVFELDRLAGEPIDLMVNNKLVARGEVVVIDEKFGVRVTETLEEIQKKGRT
ncbi:MAG: flagellar motor switch protein FliN [Candidatus Eremiobacterota bacterium]